MCSSSNLARILGLDGALYIPVGTSFTFPKGLFLMSNLRSDGKDEKSNLLASKGERYNSQSQAADASSSRIAERSKERILEIRNQINKEAAKIKSNLISVISQKPIPRNIAKKEEVAHNGHIKSTIVSIIAVNFSLIIGLVLKNWLLNLERLST